MAEVKKSPVLFPPVLLSAVQWTAIFAMLIAIVAGNYVYSEFSLLYRVLLSVGVLMTAALVFYTTPQGKSVYKLAIAARIEISRVVWPTRPEMLQSFIAVMVVIFISMLLMWMMDSLFSWLAFVLLG